MDKIKILHGNVFDKVKELNDNSIDCVVTSPPYWGLRDYGVLGQLGLESTYQEHIKNIVNLFEEIKPKLKESATIWLNYGDSYSSGKRTSTTNQTLRGNKNYGVTRTPVQDGIKEKDLVMIPNRIAIALQDAGWYIRSEIIWHKPNPMPESVKDRPTSAHEKIWLITKSKKYYYDADSIREPLASTSLTRLNQDIKNQKGSTRGNGGMKSNGNMKAVGNLETKNKRNVWTVTTKPFKDAHFATFPKDLIEPCIKAGCPEGGIVLDPFGGSGTTGIVASQNNRNAILIELNKDYIEIANKRIYKELGLFNAKS
jgi:DNA modification methylase